MKHIVRNQAKVPDRQTLFFFLLSSSHLSCHWENRDDSHRQRPETNRSGFIITQRTANKRQDISVTR